jgi:hypothetical protein
LVLGLLAGLIAMHGLGSHHDTAAHGGAEDIAEADAVPMTGHPADDAPVSDVAELCLAVLTGVAVLSLLLRAPLRALPTRAKPAGRPLRQSPRHTRPPPRPPDLSVLCVLRT